MSLRLLSNPIHSQLLTRAAVRRLYLLNLQSDLRKLIISLPLWQPTALLTSSFTTTDQLITDLCLAAIDRVFISPVADIETSAQPIRTSLEFHWRLRSRWPDVEPTLLSLLAIAHDIAQHHHQLSLLLSKATAPAWGPITFDIQDQLRRLLPENFLATTPVNWLPHLPRFLHAITVRLRKASTGGLPRDLHLLDTLSPLWQQHWQYHQSLPDPLVPPPLLADIRWLLEELRVSLFAQELKTSTSISASKILSLLQTLAPIANQPHP